MIRLLTILGATFAALLGCQSTGAAERHAVLESADAETMAEVKAALADAMGVANVELGPGDLTTSSTVTVLPPPLSPQEDRSVAAPTVFDLMLRGDACVLVRRDSGEAYDLPGASCRAR